MSTVPGGGVNSPYMNDPAYDDEFFKIFSQATPVWSAANTQTTLDQYGNDFVQQFQNAVGRAPTSDEINQFFSQAVAPVGTSAAGFAGTDPNKIAQAYIPQAFQTQIQQNQQAQLPNLENQISQIGTQVGQNTAKQLADPNNPTYQAFSGSMNNLGISPSSGAFAAGLGGTIGNAASGAVSQGLESLGFPAVGSSQSPSFASLYGQGQGASNATAGYNQNINDFNLQAQLAQTLANQSQPSGFAKDLGLANSASNVAGNIGTAAGPLATMTWICTAMNRSGVLSKAEVKELHDHLYKAFWKRPLKFIGYLLFGKCLVYLANTTNTQWQYWRSDFYDNVLAEKDPAKAVDLYEEAFWRLYRNVQNRRQFKHYGCARGS